jgi:hypothetical protein
MRFPRGSAAAAPIWIAAALLSVPPFLHPIYNSDLFWHLSAGREILRTLAVPRTAHFALQPGIPWIDFEWLSQASYQGVYAAAGFEGLWLLKLLSLGACALFLLAALKDRDVPSEFRALALAVWAAGALYYADIRPELYSLILLGALLRRLERWRADSFRISPGEFAAVFAAFALWANLHGGFLFGLAAVGCYLLPEAAQRRWREVRSLAAAAVAAAAGTLVNPYGTGPYRVLVSHWRQSAELSRSLFEWQPLVLRKDIPLQPAFALLGACAILVAVRLSAKIPWRRKLPWGLALCVAYLGAGAVAHRRVATFFEAPAILLILIAAQEAGWLKRRAAGLALAAALALDAGFVLYYTPHLSRAHPLDRELIPTQAAEFLVRERAAVEPLRIFNEWQWGGYLAWRLDPWYRVFVDGRYVFHDRLVPIHDAIVGGPRTWEEFLDRSDLDALLVDASEDAYPRILQRSGRPLGRPWHELYLPVARWALVYRDEKALFFVRRGAVAPAWIAARESPRAPPPGP